MGASEQNGSFEENTVKHDVVGGASTPPEQEKVSQNNTETPLFHIVLFNIFLFLLLIASFFFRLEKCVDPGKLGSFLLLSWTAFFITTFFLIKYAKSRFSRDITEEKLHRFQPFGKSLVVWGVAAFIISMIVSVEIVGTLCGCVVILFPYGTFTFAIASLSTGYGFIRSGVGAGYL